MRRKYTKQGGKKTKLKRKLNKTRMDSSLRDMHTEDHTCTHENSIESAGGKVK